jgi:hypothetical protein
VMRARGEPAGRYTPRHLDTVTFIAGLSGPLSTRLQLSGGLRLHNFAGEGASTTEVFLAAGIRFGSF